MQRKIRLAYTLSGTFKPETDMDKDRLKRFQVGDVLEVPEPKRSRNPAFHRKFFALMNITFNNLPDALKPYFNSMEALRKDVIMEAGFFEDRYTVHGEYYRIPQSISFGKMGEAEFSELYSKCVDTILQYYLIGVQRNDLNQSVAEEVALNF